MYQDDPLGEQERRQMNDLYLAIDNGNPIDVRRHVRKYLESPRMADDDGAMDYAVMNNRHMVHVLVEEGISVDELDTTGSTVLMHAASIGDLALATKIIDLGANVNASNANHETPFSFACACDKPDVAEMLANLGSDINCIHKDGGTPLDNKAHTPRIRSLLIRLGARHEHDIGSKE